MTLKWTKRWKANFEQDNNDDLVMSCIQIPISHITKAESIYYVYVLYLTIVKSHFNPEA